LLFPGFLKEKVSVLSPTSPRKRRGFWIRVVKNMKELKRSKNFDKMIVEAVQGNFSFFVWHKDGEVVIKCELKVKAYRKDYNEIELEFKAEQKEALSKIVSGNRIVNIYIPELSVTFS
jgi:hypothetical protein